MAKNKELWNMLNNPQWASLDEPAKTKLLAAFDDLLAVDPKNTSKFMAAVAAHAETWDIFDDAEEWANSGFGLVHYEAEEYYFSNDFLNPRDSFNFVKLHQEAAAQRVKLSLNTVDDRDVLLGIMQNNSDTLREYLAGIEPKIAVGAGWDPKKPSKDNVLTDEALVDIQQDAVARWVLLAIEDVELDVLEKLIAKTAFDFDDEIKALPGFPNEQAGLIERERIWGLVEERVRARQKELSVVAVFDDYTQYFNDLSDAEVLRMAPLLMADEANFRTDLPDDASLYSAHKGDLNSDDVNALREQLGERYLKLAVAHRIQSGEALDQLFMADTDVAFRAELKKLFPAHAYIDQVATPQFMTECKKQMAEQMISVIAKEVRDGVANYEQLLAVLSQSDEVFKKGIKAIKTTDAALLKTFPSLDLTDEAAKNQAKEHVSKMVDALFTGENQEKMDEIRQLARTRAFELAVSFVSGLAPGAHKSLVDAFSNMSVEEQERFLPKDAQDVARLSIIKHLVNAQDMSVLKHYMPNAGGDDLQAVLDSSAQRALSKQIQNPGIYKILAARFPVNLTQEQIDEINATLAGKDWNDEASYIQMVAEIKRICNVSRADETAFNKAFGLAADGVTKNDPHNFAAEIQEHNQKYEELFKEYQNSDSIINKDFLGAMLALPLPFGSIPNTPSGFYSLQKRVVSFPDREFFIDVCVGPISTGLDKKQREQLKESLDKAISPTLFHQMQADLVRDACTEQRPEAAINAVGNVEKILEKMQQAQEKIGKHLDSAKFVFDVKEIHINNLHIREQEKKSKPGESLREKYAALAKNCDAKMDELRHDHARLKSMIDALPDSVEIAQATVGAKVEALKNKLQTQLAQIDQQLEKYGQIKERIEGPDGILDMIHRVKQRPYWFYNRAEITSGVVTRDELSALAIQEGGVNPDNSQKVAIDSQDPGAAAKFQLADPLGSSQVHYFDIVQKCPQTSNTSQIVTIESRFTYDTSKSVPTTGTDRGIHRANAGCVTVEKFPDYQEGSPTDPVLLQKAKVDYAMVVATQLLATMDRPPSKDNPLRLRGANEEQLKYIWTALVVLGEKTPNMKFGPDAIRVVNDHIFNPKAQLGWGWSNFSKSSLYETVFKKHSESVNSAIEASKEHASDRLNRKGTPKSEEQLKETSQLYRSTVNTNREERVKTHGVSAETEAEQERRPSSHS